LEVYRKRLAGKPLISGRCAASPRISLGYTAGIRIAHSMTVGAATSCRANRHRRGNSMAKPTPDAVAQTMIDNLPAKTGKSADQWLRLLAGKSLEKHGEIVKWLKSEHGVTHGFANLIAHLHRDAAAGGTKGTDDPIETQYAGAKDALRPIYDEIVKHVSAFGNDVEIAPKKSYVSLRRNKQFAIVQPSTKTRVDVGINLKGQKPTKRLEKSGSFNAMVSHRVRISDKGAVDAELVGWLKSAYDKA
jgi:predicted transport protein